MSDNRRHGMNICSACRGRSGFLGNRPGYELHAFDNGDAPIMVLLHPLVHVALPVQRDDGTVAVRGLAVDRGACLKWIRALDELVRRGACDRLAPSLRRIVGHAGGGRDTGARVDDRSAGGANHLGEGSHFRAKYGRTIAVLVRCDLRVCHCHVWPRDGRALGHHRGR